MLFDSIFNLSRSSADAVKSTTNTLADYIPKKPDDDICTGPHDPWKNESKAKMQDPKIVRETSPQAQNVFELVAFLAGDMKNFTDKSEKEIKNPASIVDAAKSIMASAQKSNHESTDNMPSPSPKK